MTADANKAVYRRFCDEVLNGRRLAVLDEIMAPDIVDHSAVPGQAPGIEGVRSTVGMYLSGFPDLRVTVEQQIAEGDLVATRLSIRGTHSGMFMGIPATGKVANVTGVSVDRIVDGKIVESWQEIDALGMLTQLGVIPAPGGAPA